MGWNLARCRKLLLASVLVFSLFVIPGEADAGRPICERGAVCVWKHADFNGACWRVDFGHEGNYAGKTYDAWCNEGNGLNDSVSSAANNGERMRTRFFTDAWYAGRFNTLGRGRAWPQVWRNDQISSHKWVW